MFQVSPRLVDGHLHIHTASSPDVYVSPNPHFHKVTSHNGLAPTLKTSFTWIPCKDHLQMTWYSEDFSIGIWGHSGTSDILKGQLDLESRGVSWAQLEGKALSLGLGGSVIKVLGGSQGYGSLHMSQA